MMAAGTDSWLVEHVLRWDLDVQLPPLIATAQTQAPKEQDGSVHIQDILTSFLDNGSQYLQSMVQSGWVQQSSC